LRRMTRNGLKLLPLVLVLITGGVQASDHGDSSSAANDPVADLSDLYTWVEPFCKGSGGAGCEADPTELILALTVNPAATGADQFSEDVQYHFYIENDKGDNSQIDCSFSAEQVITCAGTGSLNNLSVSAPVGQVGVNGDIKVFAGLRDDPMFIDAEMMEEFTEIGVPALVPPGTDSLAGSNVLAIVISIKITAMPGGSEPDHNLLKIWAASDRVAGDGINGGITGLWYNSDQDGQGWVIEVVGTASGGKQFLTYFYGYDNNGEQLWLISGADTIVGSIATVEVFRTSGMGFGGDFDPARFDLGDVVGSMVFDFQDCNMGSVAFISADTAILGDFETDIERLTNIDSLDCELLTSGQVDRAGRPFVSAFIPEEMRNEYNSNSDPETWDAAYNAAILAGVTAIDLTDGVAGNAATDPQVFTDIFADDRLLVDIKKAQSSPDQYFSIEFSMMVPQDWNISAGRRPAEDVLEVHLSMLVTAWDPILDDFVTANDVPFLTEFPFLAAPH